MLFPIILDAGKSKTKVLADFVSAEACIPVLGQLRSLCVHTGRRRGSSPASLAEGH